LQGLKRYTGPAYEAETESWQKQISERGGNGMWLVSRGYHSGDDVIAIATASPLSHAAVLDLENQMVIEAVGKGVTETPLRKFLSQCHRIVLVQPEVWTTQKGNRAVTRVRDKLGEKYDFLGIIGLPSEKRWYCSEIAVWSMGIPVNRQGPQNILHPRSMLKMGKVLFDSGQRDGQPD
tara:strand:+ start:872 stop:1405 length:534 start_codon:yes stop_codon:yes gene_type:complete